MNQVSLNQNVNLSQHFTLGELTKTKYKTKDGNIPSHVQVENLKRLCGWLEHLRSQYNLLYSDGNEPVIINSGYRSPEVNKKAGGSETSNHLEGCAVDIHCYGIEQALRYAVILLNYSDNTNKQYDELYIERSPRGSYWIHLAVRPKDNRRKTAIIIS